MSNFLLLWFWFCFFVFCFFSETGSYYSRWALNLWCTWGNLELLVLPPLLSKSWGYKCVPLYLGGEYLFFFQSDNTKCWWSWVAIGIPTHCWQRCKQQPAWKAFCGFHTPWVSGPILRSVWSHRVSTGSLWMIIPNWKKPRYHQRLDGKLCASASEDAQRW